MKIFINTDLEGIAGFVNPAEFEVDTGRGAIHTKELLTDEVNAAISGASSVFPGAEFVVLDGHGGGWAGSNILVEKLDPSAKLIHGKRMKEIVGLDDSFDLFFDIGHHAMAGTQYANLSHTISMNDIYNFYINDIKVGEIGIVAMIAGYYGVPVGLVTGDYWATLEAKELFSTFESFPETVAVKKGINQYSAECLNPTVACKLIYEAAAKAVTRIGEFKPIPPNQISEVKVQFMLTTSADKAEGKGAERIDGRTVVFRGKDLMETFNLFYA